jgi:hypothetical protein
MLLSGAAAAQPAGLQSPASTCRDDAARFAVGQPYSDRLAERARRRARAGLVRKIEPGQVYTMEFRADRLNLELGPRGRIRAVRCG